jgi:hypothetical protein
VSPRRAAAEPSLRAYEAIYEHAELELELAGRGEVEQLSALQDSWEELAAALPDTPPPAAAGLLERAQLIHERTRIELLRLRDLLLAEMAKTGRARRTADGYAGQLARRPRIDHRA